MQEIMTIEEVASYLKVSERTVYEWAQKGDLPGGKIGTTWRFKSSDIEKWINDRLDNHLIKNKDNDLLSFIINDVLKPDINIVYPINNIILGNNICNILWNIVLLSVFVVGLLIDK